MVLTVPGGRCAPTPKAERLGCSSVVKCHHLPRDKGSRDSGDEVKNMFVAMINMFGKFQRTGEMKWVSSVSTLRLF